MRRLRLWESLRISHFEDLHQTIQPYAFLLNNQPFYNYLVVHVNTAQVSSVIPFLEQTWKAVRPDEPFEYSFLNEDFQRNYQADARTSRIVTYFTVISILISCLGLFGLAAFAAQQRTKEIGVRKVLGASVTSIVGLLSKDFITLVVIAIIIASPIAWYAMNQWLTAFAYKISIEWWMFAGAGLLAVGIALLTVSFQSRESRAHESGKIVEKRIDLLSAGDLSRLLKEGINLYSMLRNYLKIAWRNLWKDRVYSVINLFGLAVGVASCLLITLFVRDEHSYDRFLPDADRIFQVNVDGNFGGSEFVTSNTPPPAGKRWRVNFRKLKPIRVRFSPTTLWCSESSWVKPYIISPSRTYWPLIPIF